MRERGARPNRGLQWKGRSVDCWTCERTALAACRFCGRGACREHAKIYPFVMDLFRGDRHRVLRALVVDDAIHCGVCRPKAEPVELPELE